MRASFEDALARDPLRDFWIEWDAVYSPDLADLQQALKAAKDEQDMQAYLEANPFLLIQHLGGGHGRYVIPRMRLGSEYVPDFIICERDSIGYHWTLVEIESPLASRGRRSREASAGLNHAINQVQDWRRWLADNVAYARTELRLTDIDGNASGLVIMGRRGDGVDANRLKQVLQQNRIAVHSYDWLADTLKAKLERRLIDGRSEGPRHSALLKYRHFRNDQSTSG